MLAIKYEKGNLIGPLNMVSVIRMGLEPMTHSLEGCCSNPTELPDQPYALNSEVIIPSFKTSAKVQQKVRNGK